MGALLETTVGHPALLPSTRPPRPEPSNPIHRELRPKGRGTSVHRASPGPCPDVSEIIARSASAAAISGGVSPTKLVPASVMGRHRSFRDEELCHGRGLPIESCIPNVIPSCDHRRVVHAPETGLGVNAGSRGISQEVSTARPLPARQSGTPSTARARPSRTGRDMRRLYGRPRQSG